MPLSALDMAPYDYETPVILDPDRPKFGLLWEHIETLQYRASLLEVRAGVRCRVVRVYEHNPAEETADRPAEPEEVFEILTAHASAGPLEYKVALAWMDAFEEGVNECRWVYSEDPTA